MRHYFIILTLLVTGCATTKGGPCRGVIGAGYDTHSGVVDYVYPGSPAREIGVELGDTLINIDKWSGNAGDVVVVEWTHDSGESVVQVSHSATLVCVDKYREEW